MPERKKKINKTLESEDGQNKIKTKNKKKHTTLNDIRSMRNQEYRRYQANYRIKLSVECQNHRMAIVVSGIFEDTVKVKSQLYPSDSQNLWALPCLNFSYKL